MLKVESAVETNMLILSCALGECFSLPEPAFRKGNHQDYIKYSSFGVTGYVECVIVLYWG